MVHPLLMSLAITGPPSWLAQDHCFPLIMASLWATTTGYVTPLLLAGVDRLPPYFFEDCALAGAPAFQRLRFGSVVCHHAVVEIDRYHQVMLESQRACAI